LKIPNLRWIVIVAAYKLYIPYLSHWLQFFSIHLHKTQYYLFLREDTILFIIMNIDRI